MTVGPWDWTIIIVYLLGIVGLGCWAGLKRKSSEGAGYFLADKSLSWPIIGLALFSTNISTIHLHIAYRCDHFRRIFARRSRR